MYDYGMVKSIHDQRMRQYQIEAERAHLVRQLRRSRPQRTGLIGRVTLRLREAAGTVVAAMRPRVIAS
jgi:hypothetical protein